MVITLAPHAISLLDEMAARYDTQPEKLVAYAVDALIEGSVPPFADWLAKEG